MEKIVDLSFQSSALNHYIKVTNKLGTKLEPRAEALEFC